MKIRIAAILLLFASSCSNLEGPLPQIGSVTVRPPERAGEPYKVDVEVRNESAGNGTASLEIRLKDPATQIHYQENTTVHLDSHETAHRVVVIFAPVGNYLPEAKVTYPPE